METFLEQLDPVLSDILAAKNESDQLLAVMKTTKQYVISKNFR